MVVTFKLSYFKVTFFVKMLYAVQETIERIINPYPNTDHQDKSSVKSEATTNPTPTIEIKIKRIFLGLIDSLNTKRLPMIVDIGVKEAKIAPAEDEIKSKAVFSKEEYKKIPMSAAKKKIKKSAFVILKFIRFENARIKTKITARTYRRNPKTTGLTTSSMMEMLTKEIPQKTTTSDIDINPPTFFI